MQKRGRGKQQAETNQEDAILQCVETEPMLVKRIFDQRGEVCKNFVSLFLEKDIRKVYFSGQASGIFVAKMLQPFMEKLLKVEVSVTNPAYFNQYETFNINQIYKPEQMVMLCPAHSGTTTGPIQMAKKCRELGISVVCSTYDTTSTLANLSDVVIYKFSGPEASYVETKSHMASLAIFFLCIIETAKAMNNITKEEYIYYCNYFETLPKHMEMIIQDTKQWYETHKNLFTVDKARYVGFGPYYAMALEGSLKIAEATNISSLVYDMEEFMHTSTTQIEADSLIYVIAPNCEELERMNDLLSWCRDHSDKVVLLANNNHPMKDHNALTSAFLDDPYLSVMEYLIPFQLLAHYIAKDRKLSVIHARNDGASKRLKTHVEE